MYEVGAIMNNLLVMQHTESEYLGLLEDQFELRRIGFQYLRPFSDNSWQLKAYGVFDGLILLGGGPWGSAGKRNLPSLSDEVRFCEQCLTDGIPVVGFGLGAQILALAAGGTSEPAPFEFDLIKARRAENSPAEALLPETFDIVSYGRDRAVPPEDAVILARDENNNGVVFQIGDNCFGFAGNPGVKSGIVEDLIMEFEESPEGAVERLKELRALHPQLEQALHHITVGLVQCTGWMRRSCED
jgi:GMP synthase-like glutamine amidotransferase